MINIVIILYNKELENIISPCLWCQHRRHGVTFTYKNLKLCRFKNKNQPEIKKK
jgi:hypothetical protein